MSYPLPCSYSCSLRSLNTSTGAIATGATAPATKLAHGETMLTALVKTPTHTGWRFY